MTEMMNKMYKKLGKKGFTLMEMLIVVAIIAILIAIAIPTFSSALTKAKAATDNANNRALKGLIMTNYMFGDEAEVAIKNGSTYYLNAEGDGITTAEPNATTAIAYKGDSTKYVGATVTITADNKITLVYQYTPAVAEADED